jgi:DedD protein
MDVQLKQRVVGAAVLAALAVIFVPVLLDDGRRHEQAPLPPPVTIVPDPARARAPEAPPGAALEDIERGMGATPEELSRMPVETRVPIEPEVVPGDAPARPATPASKAGAAKAGSGEPAQRGENARGTPEQWTVQLGTFSNETNASALQAKLKQAGITASVEKPAAPGKPYRVQTGTLASRDKAESLRRRLEKDFEVRGIVKRLP